MRMFLSAALLGFGVLQTSFAATPISLTEQARMLHSQSLVIDTHDDTTQRMIWEQFDLGDKHQYGSIDIPRMKAGGLGGIFFSIWMPGSITGQTAVDDALKQIYIVRQQVKKHPKDIVLCTTADEVLAAHAKGKIAALIGMEGGHMINNDLANLHRFADLGVKYMTLTHSMNTDWADSSSTRPAHNGLTSFGKKVVMEMNKLGMMVDISHVSDRTFYDALAISKAPIIASHSSCRALAHTARNMSDEMIKALAAKGGVIQINYHVGFLSQTFHEASRTSVALDQLQHDLHLKCGANEACQLIGGEIKAHQLMEEGELPNVSWKKIIEHINHVVELVGVDHVGLGSDFDGAIMPLGMEDASHLPQITQALLEEGYSNSDIQKILGGNTLRVMRQVEAVAKRLT